VVLPKTPQPLQQSRNVQSQPGTAIPFGYKQRINNRLIYNGKTALLKPDPTVL
jgi:hypothetical protein